MANWLLVKWARAQKIPFGQFFFNRMLAWNIPYTATIGSRVVTLEAGFARVTMRDRRRVRNHLASIHAVALLNLAEFSTGLALTSRLPPDQRAILTALSMEYLKKARGLLTVEASCPPIETAERKTMEIEGLIRNEVGDIVARGKACWLVGPK